MRAARAAGMTAIGVCTNQSAGVLTGAGAEQTVNAPKDLERLWLIDKPE